MTQEISDNDLIKEVYLRSLDWKRVDNNSVIPRYERLVGSKPDSVGYYYGRTVVKMTATVGRFIDNYYAVIIFESIDSGTASINGPQEDIEKATRRLYSIKDAFSKIEFIPSEEEISSMISKTGMWLELP